MAAVARGPAPELVSPFRRGVFELAARWYVFLFLNVYGWGKIDQLLVNLFGHGRG
jgi:hypothetical protein